MDEELIRRLYCELRPVAVVYARMAPHLYDADDLLQIAMLEIAQATGRTGRTDMKYLVGVARMEMWQTIERVVHVSSLDAYLYDEERDIRRDVAAPPGYRTPTASPAHRRQIFWLLRSCTERQAFVLMASYQITDRRGRCRTKEEVCLAYGMSKQRFSEVRHKAVRRLSTNYFML